MSEPVVSAEWLTTSEVAARLKLTVSGVRALVRRGRIVPDHHGKRGQSLAGHRFRVETVEAFLRGTGGEHG